MRTHSRIIIGHHLILHGYGHWLPNDPRGSGSDELRQEKLTDLGPIHFGRKSVQPPRHELREFHRTAAPRLDFPLVWFDDAKRQALGDSIAQTVRDQGYTVWACAVMRNHMHLCVRRHRDNARAMWDKFADSARSGLRLFASVSDAHPIWSLRPYKVFLYSPADVRRVVAYIEYNTAKDKLPVQSHPFVTTYDGWPHNPPPAKKRRR
ncbi:MAG TPA: hypothetical protein VGM05_22805 [Planctomycetaceae bacterium]|jgi:REP element-mobilizing transposase RayT